MSSTRNYRNFTESSESKCDFYIDPKTGNRFPGYYRKFVEDTVKIEQKNDEAIRKARQNNPRRYYSDPYCQSDSLQPSSSKSNVTVYYIGCNPSDPVQLCSLQCAVNTFK